MQTVDAAMPRAQVRSEHAHGEPSGAVSWHRLSYAGVSVNMHASTALAQQTSAQVAPFFDLQPQRADDGEVDLHLIAGPVPASLLAACTHAPQIVKVDTSLYQHLASDGERWDLGDRQLVRIVLTGTYALIDRRNRRIDLYQADAELMVRDAVRLLKGLLTVVTESRGGVQLHASGVAIDGRGVLLMGDMWQGKTTVLLELLREFNVHQLSCDTVTLLPAPNRGVDSSTAAWGWPSPFSISHGTLADNPQLYEFFPPERRAVPYDTLWAEGKKAVLTSQHVVDRCGTAIAPHVPRVDTCLLVRFQPNEPTGMTRVTELAQLERHLQSVYLGSRDPIYHNWHRYREIDDAVIDANIRAMAARLYSHCDVYTVTWAPSVVSLLKRVPALGAAHKDLSRLLTRFSVD